MPSQWARYVKDVAANAPQRDIAAISGIDTSAISRWLSGRARPQPEQAIKFARAYARPALEALVAAGYLEESEATQAPPAFEVRPLSDYTDEAVIAALEHHWLEGGRFMAEMLNRWLGRPVHLGAATVIIAAGGADAARQTEPNPGRRKLDPARLGSISNDELLSATDDLMNQRTLLMQELARRLRTQDGQQ